MFVFFGTTNNDGIVGGTPGTKLYILIFIRISLKTTFLIYSPTTGFLKVDLFTRHCFMAFPFLTLIISIREIT